MQPLDQSRVRKSGRSRRRFRPTTARARNQTRLPRFDRVRAARRTFGPRACRVAAHLSTRRDDLTRQHDAPRSELNGLSSQGHGQDHARSLARRKPGLRGHCACANPPARRENLSASLCPTERSRPRTRRFRARVGAISTRAIAHSPPLREFASGSRGRASRRSRRALAPEARRRFSRRTPFPCTRKNRERRETGVDRLKHPRKLSRQGFFSFPLSARPRAASLPKTRPVPTRSTDAPPLTASPHRAVQHGGRVLPELLPGWPRPRARVRGQVRVVTYVSCVIYPPSAANDKNDDDETECVRGAPRPAPPPPPRRPTGPDDRPASPPTRRSPLTGGLDMMIQAEHWRFVRPRPRTPLRPAPPRRVRVVSFLRLASLGRLKPSTAPNASHRPNASPEPPPPFAAPRRTSSSKTPSRSSATSKATIRSSR